MEPIFMPRIEQEPVNVRRTKRLGFNFPNSFSDSQNEIILGSGMEKPGKAWTMNFVPENETEIEL